MVYFAVGQHAIQVHLSMGSYIVPALTDGVRCMGNTLEHAQAWAIVRSSTAIELVLHELPPSYLVKR